MNNEASIVKKISILAMTFSIIALLTTISHAIQSLYNSYAADECIYDTWRWTTMYFTELMESNQSLNKFAIGLDSLMIDILGIYFLYLYIVKGTIALVYTIILFFIFRFLSLGFAGKWPKPIPYLFINPGVPSLFIPYDATNDYYFSGHVGQTVIICITSYYMRRKKLTIIALLVFVYTIFILLVVGGHYFNDLLIGLVVATVSSWIVIQYVFELNLYVLNAGCTSYSYIGDKIYKKGETTNKMDINDTLC